MRVILRIPEPPGQFLVIDTDLFKGIWTLFAKKLKQGIRWWMDHTPDGRRAKIESRGRFTLLDLKDYVPDCFLRGTSLGLSLRKYGIDSFTMEVIENPADAEVLTIDSNLYGGK